MGFRYSGASGAPIIGRFFHSLSRWAYIMENELLQQLGTKLDQLLDEMELLRMELNEVRTERDELLAQQNQ